MEDNSLSQLLTVPDQKLTALSFCEATARGIEAWTKGLPMANVGETAKRLYHAVSELNQLIIAPGTRFQMLETIRPPIYFVCQELAKHFLNQGVVLPEKQRKIANLAQALQLHLANGYKVVLLDGLGQGQADKIRKVLPIACHRAISDLAQTVLRSAQLYCNSPPQVWLDIHQIHALAEQQRFMTVEVTDDQCRHIRTTSIGEAYKRVLLLGCSKPNKLRQADVAHLYEAFEGWARHVQIDPKAADTALFVFSIEHDAPPIYRSLHQGHISPDVWGLDPSRLVQLLSDYLEQLNNKKFDAGDLIVPPHISENLLIHVSQAVGVLAKRSFKRISSNGLLSICVGLSATHYFCSDGVDFSLQLIAKQAHESGDGDDETNLFARRMKHLDTWASNEFNNSRNGDSNADLTPINYTGISNKQTNSEQNPQSTLYKQYQVPLVNTSPGGYCLKWEGEIPANVQAGEILGVREATTHAWSIAVIRWIRQVKQQGTQIGIELLAPSAQPCGVQLIGKTGDSEYLRGLLLPELAPTGQPTTLITPRLPFQTGHRVVINRMGEEAKTQLTARTAATNSFSRYELRNPSSLTTPEESTSLSLKSLDDEFDSLWPSL